MWPELGRKIFGLKRTSQLFFPLLIKAGADVCAVNWTEKTPLYFAYNVDCGEALQRAMLENRYDAAQISHQQRLSSEKVGGREERKYCANCLQDILYQKRGYNSCASAPVVLLYLRPNMVFSSMLPYD
jgi:hypothetical protein